MATSKKESSAVRAQLEPASEVADQPGERAAQVLDRRSAATLRWTVLGFLLVLFAAEAFARRRPTEATRWGAWLSRQSPHAAVIIGDSAAQQGLSPSTIATAARLDSINFALSSGSGILAREAANHVGWRPSLVVYAGVPIEPFDTWDLQRIERQLVSSSTLLSNHLFTGGTALSRASALYRSSYLVYPLLLQRTRATLGFATPPDPAASAARQEPDGFLAICLDPGGCDANCQEAAAERKAKIWFTRQTSGSIRYEALIDAMREWSGPGARRALIIMPISSPLRSTLFKHIPRIDILQRWQMAATESDSSLLDCLDSMPDDAFYDDDHLAIQGAAELSARLAPWLAAQLAGETAPIPHGCAQVR